MKGKLINIVNKFLTTPWKTEKILLNLKHLYVSDYQQYKNMFIWDFGDKN